MCVSVLAEVLRGVDLPQKKMATSQIERGGWGYQRSNHCSSSFITVAYWLLFE